MMIGVDLRCLPTDGSSGSGVAHAARALVREMIRQSSTSVRWTLFIPRGAAWEDAGDGAQRVMLNHAGGSALRRSITQHPCDVLFVPSGAVAPGLTTCFIVPWVHDIAIFEHPEWFPESFFQRLISTHLFRRGLVHAQQVLSVSECTKKELIGKFRLDPTSIIVTSEGGDDALAALDGEALVSAKQRARRRVMERGMSNPFLLCLGTLEPRKNIPTMLEAYRRARTFFSRPVDLVIAGRDGWKTETVSPLLKHVMTESVSASKGKVHRVRVVSDEERRDLVWGADVVVVPSVHEGFGLVALEAMQAGTALIVSSAGALPEVVGDGARVIAPHDREAWTQSVIELINHEKARSRLADVGKRRSYKMTWERSGRIALDVLTSCAV